MINTNKELTSSHNQEPTYVPTISSSIVSPLMEENSRVKDEAKIPNEYLCPITLELMIDPVVAADGHTYERYALEEWFATGKSTSPITGKDLPHLTLTPNYSLRSMILTYKEQLPRVEQERIKQTPNHLPKQEDQDHWTAIVLQQQDLLTKNPPHNNNDNKEKLGSFSVSVKESYQHTALFTLLPSHPNLLSSPINNLRSPFVTVELIRKGLLLTYKGEDNFISKVAFEKEGKEIFNELTQHIHEGDYGISGLDFSVSTKEEKLFLIIKTQFSSDAEDLNELLEEFINKLNKRDSIHGTLTTHQTHKMLNIEYKKHPDLMTEIEYKEKAKVAYEKVQNFLETTDKSDLIINSSPQKDSLFLQTRWTDDAEDLKDLLEEEGIAVDSSKISLHK